MDAIPAAIRELAERRLRERCVYGLALCAFDADGPIFGGGVGHADLRRGEEVTADTVFRVASISKLITATLALGLVDDGVLDLDAPVNRYLPDATQVTDPTGAPATVGLRHLLSHHSGLPPGVRGALVPNPILSLVANGGRVRDLHHAVAGLRQVRPAGEAVIYSNPAYNLIGVASARAAGERFEAAARRRVLAPLAMDGAAFAPRRSGPGVATPYGTMLAPRATADPADALRLVATPMGGLTASARALSRFGRMVLRGGELDGARVVDADRLAEATTLRATNHPALEQGYGLGFKVRRWQGRTLVGHDGNMPGVATRLVLSPLDGVGVVVLTNGPLLGVPHEVATATLRHLLDPSPTPPATGTVGPAMDAAARAAAGRYRFVDAVPPGVAGKVMALASRPQVTAEPGGRLRLDGASDGPIWLQPVAEGRYRLAGSVDDGTDAVIESRPDGRHLWFGFTGHLQQRRR